MVFSIIFLLAIIFTAIRLSPREKKEHAHVHGAGQIGLLAAVALFGVDYFTSFYYGTGEMMSALHPYGLQRYGYLIAIFIGLANMIFDALYTYSLGISFVQTSFLFYGGLTTMFLTIFAIRFNVFDGTLGRTLVGNLAWIGFSQVPGGTILYWADQILAVGLLAAASMTALQDAQATEWRDVAIGEIPEAIVYRDPRGAFTRSVTITFAVAVLIMFLVHGRTTAAVPYYGVGVFMPIMVMGLEVRKHILTHYTGRTRTLRAAGALMATILGGLVFIGQIVGKWQEGGWAVL